MSKVLAAVVVVAGTLIAGDRLLGTLARGRQADVQDAKSDLRQILRASEKNDKTGTSALDLKTDVAKDLQPLLAKMQERNQKFNKEFDSHALPDAFDWEHLATQKGREATLKSLDGELATCQSYYKDICKLRTEMAAALGKHGHKQTGSLDDDNAADGRVERARVALYDKYRKYIRAIGASKLLKQGDETFYVNDSDRKRCEALLDDVVKAEKQFEDERKALLTAREKKREAALSLLNG